jgi:hypothetical protein
LSGKLIHPLGANAVLEFFVTAVQQFLLTVQVGIGHGVNLVHPVLAAENIFDLVNTGNCCFKQNPPAALRGETVLMFCIVRTTCFMLLSRSMCFSTGVERSMTGRHQQQ